MKTFNQHLVREIDQLNHGFIELMLAAAQDGRLPMGTQVYDRLRRSSDGNRAFESCPFLLFRLCFDDAPLTDDAPSLSRDHDRASALALLTLTFLHQVATDDIAAATLICGADRQWCRELTATSLVRLPAISELASLRPRLVDVPGYWQDLSRPGGISSLQRASLGPAGWQIIMSRNRRQRLPRALPDIQVPTNTLHDKSR